MANKTLPTKEEVVETPKNVVLDAVVIDVTIESWQEHLGDSPGLNKIREQDIDIEQDQVFITFETENGHRDNTVATYYDKPSERSKLGKLLLAYGEIKPGTQVKVHYNDKGKSTVQV